MMMNKTCTSQTRSLAFLVSVFAWANAHAVTPLLDRQAYLLSGHINIDLTNQIVSFTSNMSQCRQANGDPPLDSQLLALHTNKQFIGLHSLRYDTISNQLQMTSETLDLKCNNAVFVDDIYQNDFELLIID
jgi:hypothetical protein